MIRIIWAPIWVAVMVLLTLYRILCGIAGLVGWSVRMVRHDHR